VDGAERAGARFVEVKYLSRNGEQVSRRLCGSVPGGV